MHYFSVIYPFCNYLSIMSEWVVLEKINLIFLEKFRYKELINTFMHSSIVHASLVSMYLKYMYNIDSKHGIGQCF